MMRQVTPDDALIGLLHAVILQAVEDYRGLQSRGVFLKGEVNEGFFCRYGSNSAGYRRPMNFQRESEIGELLHFFQGWPLDLLGDLTGIPACRVRRALGIHRKSES